VRGSQRNTAHHSTVLSKGKHTITWKFKKQANSNGKLKITNLKMTKETSITPVASISHPWKWWWWWKQQLSPVIRAGINVG